MALPQDPWGRIPASPRSGQKPPLRLREATPPDADTQRRAPVQDADDRGEAADPTHADPTLRPRERGSLRVVALP